MSRSSTVCLVSHSGRHAVLLAFPALVLPLLPLVCSLSSRLSSSGSCGGRCGFGRSRPLKHSALSSGEYPMEHKWSSNCLEVSASAKGSSAGLWLALMTSFWRFVIIRAATPGVAVAALRAPPSEVVSLVLWHSQCCRGTGEEEPDRVRRPE